MAVNTLPPQATQSTSLTYGQQDIPKRKKLTDKEQCELDGGYWDAERKVCLKVKPGDKLKEAPKVKPTVPEVGEIEGTAKQSVTLPDGRTFYGLNKEEVQQLVQGEAEQKARLEGTAPIGTAQQQAEEQFRLQQAVGQIGQVGELTEAEQAKINYSQALTAGTIGSAPNIVRNAAVGFAGGALVGGGVTPLAVVTGVAGALSAIWSGVNANIKDQQKGELQAADIELTNARTNMRQLAMLASQDPSNADIYIAQYNQQLTRIHQARRQTKAEVTGDLNAWIEDGREQLADFDAFLQPGGIADVYGQKLEIALTKGVPLSITESEYLFPE